MTKMGLLVLRGQGDQYVKLVDEATIEWIARDDTPGREGRETYWVDSAVPPAVKGDLGDDEEVGVTSGSYQNDRAMHASNVASFPDFDSVKEAKAHAKANDIEIVDEYHGCIY
jgi:hypothetical protein